MLHNEVQSFLYDNIHFYGRVFSWDVYEIAILRLHEITSKCRMQKENKNPPIASRKLCILWVRVKFEETYLNADYYRLSCNLVPKTILIGCVNLQGPP